MSKKIETKVYFVNNAVDVVYKAASSCYNNYDKTKSYAERTSYITKRVMSGHTSILEHAYMTVLLKDVKLDSNFAELINCCEFLTIFTSELVNDIGDYTNNILVGGSLRGYHNMLENMESYPDNPYLQAILSELYDNTDRCFFEDLDNLDFLELDQFIVPNDVHLFTDMTIDLSNVPYSNMVINYLPNIKESVEELVSYGFMYEDIFKFIPITVNFIGISRTAAMQLIRHRNGITQESQRYVKATGFKLPNGDKYEDKTFDIKLLDQKTQLTLRGLADVFFSVYNQLIEQGLTKEDARALLPQNTKVNNLYVTFTIFRLYKFFYLRTYKNAQYEIRRFALNLRYSLNKIEYYDEMYKIWLDSHT